MIKQSRVGDVTKMRNTIIQGDALSTLKQFPDTCVQCCVTSPPYYRLRSYLPGGHPDKPLEVGLEDTPQQYVDCLVSVLREVKRVLREDGVLWLNLGDTYAGTSRGGNPALCRKNWQPTYPKGGVYPGLAAKQLLGIPWRVAFALQADGWYLRSDVIWCKGNALPESVKDRPARVHEYLFLFAKSECYFYDADAIREPAVTTGNLRKKADESWGKLAQRASVGEGLREWNHPRGRNKRSVWMINTQPFPEAHFAVMPSKLVEPCILAGSRPGDLVLDPFVGAGTVAAVAKQLGRCYLGIELNTAYIRLAEKRLAHLPWSLWQTAEEVNA